MARVEDRGLRPDLVKTYQSLCDSGEIQLAGGVPYLAGLTSYPTIPGLEDKMLEEVAEQRRVYRQLLEALEELERVLGESR